MIVDRRRSTMDYAAAEFAGITDMWKVDVSSANSATKYLYMACTNDTSSATARISCLSKSALKGRNDAGTDSDQCTCHCPK